MVCTLGSKPQGPCERRGQRRRPTNRYWFPAIGRQLQRVGCTPSTGANLVLWHTRILFHAICTFCFPAYDRPLPCHQTSPGQQPLRPFPSLALASGPEIGKGFGPRAQPYYWLSIHHHHQPPPPLDRAEYETNSATESLQQPTQPLWRREARRIFPDRPACISARYTRLSSRNHYLISSSPPLLTTYH
jgi:hypothetical protein